MSSFVLNRNCKLQLPTSFVEIDREEMEYVDGGLAVSVKFAGAAFNALITGALGVGTAGVKGAICAIGKEEAKKIFTRTVVSTLKSWGMSKLAWGVGWAIDTALNYADIGTAIANSLDSIDTYGTNGWIG